MKWKYEKLKKELGVWKINVGESYITGNLDIKGSNLYHATIDSCGDFEVWYALKLLMHKKVKVKRTVENLLELIKQHEVEIREN